MTERAWLDAARGRTVREVEALVFGQRPGSHPGDLPDPSLKRHVLRLEVSGETLATFREAIAEIRRAAGGSLDEDSAIFQLCRGVLAGTRDEGRSNYQVALTVCERCGAGEQQGRGELVGVAQEVVGMAECDGQYVGRIAPSRERDDAYAGETRRANQHAGHSAPCDDAHVGKTQQVTRAAQTIPPALRRRVMRRDGGRCQVQGCTHATFVDVHHLVPRSEGGDNTLENLVTLCGAHHRAIHAGKLLSAGTPSRGLAFRHADGTPYGRVPAAAGDDVRAKTSRALVQLGFRESEAKRAIAQVASFSDVTVETLLRAALGELAPNL